MTWEALAWLFIAPAVMTLGTALAFRNWRLRREGTELWHVCVMAGLAAGMISQATFQVACKAFDWQIHGDAFTAVLVTVAGGPVIAGLLIGRVLQRRLKGRGTPQVEQDYGEPER